jgi:hypothetical protein
MGVRHCPQVSTLLPEIGPREGMCSSRKNARQPCQHALKITGESLDWR